MSTVFDLNAMIAKLEELQHAPERIVEAAQQELSAHVASTINAQTDAYGASWVPSKDGRRMLTGAVKAITYIVRGTKLRMTLTGVEAQHHYGQIRGSSKKHSLRRPIIPHKPFLPSAVAERLLARLQQLVNEVMK